MSGVHVGVEQKPVVICFQLAQACYPLGGFPILHLAIMQSRSDEQVGVIGFRYIIIRGIGKHVIIILLVFWIDRKSTRLNSSHVKISYAVFCLKKKKKQETQ